MVVFTIMCAFAACDDHACGCVKNMDDCWAASRNASGFIEPDPKAFPSGIHALADYGIRHHSTASTHPPSLFPHLPLRVCHTPYSREKFHVSSLTRIEIRII